MWSGELQQRLQFSQRLIQVVIDDDGIELPLGLQFLTGPGKTFLNRRLRIGPSTTDPLFQFREAWRSQKDLEGLRKRVPNLAGTLQFNLKQNRRPGGESRFNRLPRSAVAIACKFGPLQKPSCCHQVVKTVATVEEIVFAVLFPWTRRACGGRHREPQTGVPLTQTRHQGALSHPAGACEHREPGSGLRWGHGLGEIAPQGRKASCTADSTNAPMGLPSPQAMDFTALSAVVADLRTRVLPSRFEKAQQPDAQTLQLGCRTLKGMVWLELSWQADCPRLTQIPAPPRQGSGSTLAQQSQHGLRQLALVELQQQPFERVVQFGFAARPGSPVQRWLILEVMGRHSNLLLLDERQRIIALGRQVRDHQSRVRPIGTGDPYVSPPALQGRPPQADEGFERWKQRLSLLPLSLDKALAKTYQGISPALGRQLGQDLLKSPVSELTSGQWQALHRRWTRWLTCLDNRSFAVRFDANGGYVVWDPDAVPAPVDASEGEPLSLALGRFYSARLQARTLERQSHELRQQLLLARRREQDQLDDQTTRLQATHDADALQQQADAILCLPSPDRDQINEAQKLYRKARKLRRAVPLLEERQRHHRQRLELIEGSESFLEDVLASDWDQGGDRLLHLEDLRREAQDLLAPRQRRRRQAAGSCPEHQPHPLALRSPGGLAILVGRNHRQNDWISLRQARPGDLWFHAQECPGSHVVLKASSGMAEEGDLDLAADLAAYFSRARGNRRVAVVMVPVEQLQRIVGAGPGTVRHRGGSVRWAEPGRAEQRLQAGELLACTKP